MHKNQFFVRLGMILTITAVSLTTVLFIISPHALLAQGGVDVDKQLGRTDPVVHVGEYLTFTIRIQNNSGFTITTLPLSDTYNAAVLGYVDAVPAPDSVVTTTGRLDWNDLTTFFGDLAPGQQVTVVVGFIAEHPETAVVNAAAVHDAISSGGAVPGGNDDDSNAESMGGSAPVSKMLSDLITPEVGLPITFTLHITNSGFTTMTVLPLFDNYDPAFLQFSHAVPPPDMVDNVAGALTWNDLTLWSGDISAQGFISVTTVFTALTATSGITNSAFVLGARDWYDNDLAGGSDNVPITIIGGGGGPDATATPMPTPVPNTPAPAPAATQAAVSTATTISTATTVSTATAIPTPARLPDTGVPPQQQNAPSVAWAILAALLPIIGWLGFRKWTVDS